MRIGLYVAPGGPAGAFPAGGAFRPLVESLGAIAVPIAGHGPGPLSVDGVVLVAALSPDAGSMANAGAAATMPTAAAAMSMPAADEIARPLRLIEAFARAGGPVLGVGGGFQILCAMGLLPGRVICAGPDEPRGLASHLRVEGRPTPFTSAIPAGRVILLRSGAPPDGCYEIDDPAALEARGQVIFRYCDAAGGTARASAGGAAPRSIAGVCDAGGSVVGLLPDPGAEAQQLLRSLRMHA